MDNCNKAWAEFFVKLWNQGAAISWGCKDDGLNEHDSVFFADINGQRVEQGKEYNTWIEEDGIKFDVEHVRITAIRDNVIRFAKEGSIFSAAIKGCNPENGKQWLRAFRPIGK